MFNCTSKIDIFITITRYFTNPKDTAFHFSYILKKAISLLCSGSKSYILSNMHDAYLLLNKSDLREILFPLVYKLFFWDFLYYLDWVEKTLIRISMEFYRSSDIQYFIFSFLQV